MKIYAKMKFMASYIVTGGAGFIGSHLCERLLAEGSRVICIDNLLTGTENNIREFKNNPNFLFLNHDVINPVTLSDRIDAIFHLASPASVPDYQKYAEQTALVNSVGTRNMLLLAKRKKAGFLFASTSEIYGDPQEHPQRETYWGNVNPNGIRACYDESKRFGEMMTMLFHRHESVDARIIRIFNTYGPRMRKTDGRVISNLANQALEGKPMTVYGDGHQTRSFCFVTDLVDGIMKAMFTGGTDGEVINLGNPDEYAMGDLARIIKEMTGSASEIVHHDLPQDDPIKRRPDIAKAKRLLGWEPVVPLRKGLMYTIEWYKQSPY